jgi:hypothetical protein
LGSPKLYETGQDTVIPPFDYQYVREPSVNYVGENMSRRDWIEFKLNVDGKTVFEGEKYTSIVRRPDHEITLGTLAPGKHVISLSLTANYESSVGFVLQQLDLIEYGNHEFEIIGAPEYAAKNDVCRVLLKTNRFNVSINASGKTYFFEQAGLHGIQLPPVKKDSTITLSSDTFDDSFFVRFIPEEKDDLYLSTGDIIFIQHDPESILKYLEWYIGNRIGNAICLRHAYRWGGGRTLNPEIWKKLIPLLNELGISYTLMVDARELPGMNANPGDKLLQGIGYLGRQAHENDGAFCYWGKNFWMYSSIPGAFVDIFSRNVDKGGIYPQMRPCRLDDGTIWYFDPTVASDMKEAAAAFVENISQSRGESTRHSGPSPLFRYFFQAGYKFLIAEQMYGPEEIVLASLRGASKAYRANGFGSHLATQWSSIPHDTQEHAERYFLSLATCYLQGVTQINTEEGLYRMENRYANHDRFSRNAELHLEAHTRFRRFLETHRRHGKINVPVGVVQGRYDGWNIFSEESVWKRKGDYWKFNSSEESFDLLKVFYPRSLIRAIYRFPCPVSPQGWYTGTPYGLLDLTPFEGDWKNYRVLIFLGWHSFENGDGDKLLAYVKNGGTLLLSRKHLSISTERNHATVLPDDPALDSLLGKGWRTATGIIRHEVGEGKVIYFADEAYPGDKVIREEYEYEMKSLGEMIMHEECERGWIKANEDVNFSVYDCEDGIRVIYLLNIRWWDKRESEVTLLLEEKEIPIRVREGNIHILKIADNQLIDSESV